MDRDEILSLYDRHERIEQTDPGMTREVLPGLVRLLRPAPGSSRITYTKLTAENADPVIDEQLEFFRSRRRQFCWPVFGHDSPPDLRDRLAARGLEVSEVEEVLVLDLASLPAVLRQPPASLLRPGINAEIRPITQPEQLQDVQDVLEAVWGENFTWVHERMGGYLQVPGFIEIYGGYVDGKPASAAWIFLAGDSPFAGLYGGSTLAEQRGNGFYTALLAARAQAALRRGKQFLYIDAGPMSAPIARRHGFSLLTTVQDCDYIPR